MNQEPSNQPPVDGDSSLPAGETEAAAPGAFSMDALMDVAMPVVIEIGRTSMTLNEILRLSPGSVVQLDRAVGDAVDIYVSDRKLAEGEVVVVGDRFGVRVTRVLSEPARSAA